MQGKRVGSETHMRIGKHPKSQSLEILDGVGRVPRVLKGLGAVAPYYILECICAACRIVVEVYHVVH